MNAIEQGRALRRLRMLKGIKQSHLGELLGVDQASISRWERGTVPLGEDRWRTVLDLLVTAPKPAEDAALKRLVTSSNAKVHLICDHSHRLLAASLPRQAEWHAHLLGSSLLPYATAEILAAEEGLADRGWHEGFLVSLTLETGANHDPVLPIAPSRVLWERMTLADGSAARLVTTVG
ncbi:helix-turn-helix transcriptional regulator [Labrys sp. KNU-23]|uniref:helix-turn-helix domain-containing protein n=1 Tax=Labrys sp. KNU-23 TaxID=2789216 RepID=UPI0011ECD7E4|nr:helix-turn-helix transcriptional regulator [Labrys sp. KNU-23]QEN90972.1 helix-turn-helix transcriptional regulator [Labrys sp. KNU-23]